MHRLIVSIAWLTCLVAQAAHAKLDVFACEPEWAALTRTLGGDDVSVYQATTALQAPAAATFLMFRPSMPPMATTGWGLTLTAL